jgi:diguanylate cyclase (GGDEF)-like protein
VAAAPDSRTQVSAPEGVATQVSPYATQLRQGFRGLRFARVIEAEFQEEFAHQHLARMRIGFGVAVVLYLVFLLLRLRTESGPVEDWALSLRLAAIATMLATVGASYVRQLRPHVPYLVLASYAVFAGGVTAIECLAQRYGASRHYEVLILLSFHVYVFSGLLFRSALLAGAFIFLAYLIGGALGGLASKAWGYQLLFIALTHAIGGAALYLVERVERDNFLRRRLLVVLAAHDSLTGLFNRMAFFQQFERTVRMAVRAQMPIGVVLLDIDYFKAYNDRYGHLEGDACLRAVAQAVAEEFRRPLDVVARYGGEEFVGVWYDVQPQSIRSLADQVRAAVQALRIANRDAPSGRITVSVGAVVGIPQEGESLLALIQRADTALYEAKERGRNRVVVEILPSAQHPPVPGGRRAPSLTAG